MSTSSLFLTKDGITIEVTHPIDIARYKKIGFKEMQDVGTPAPQEPIVRTGLRPAPTGRESNSPKSTKKVNHEPETSQS